MRFSARYHWPLRGLLLTAGLLIAACQGQAPTVVYIVITPTPELTAEVTPAAATTDDAIAGVPSATMVIPTAAPATATPLPPTITPDLTAAAQAGATQTAAVDRVLTATAQANTAAATIVPTAPPTSAAPVQTVVPAGFPTPVIAQIQVAEQLFENGRMYWLQPTGEIWVLVITAEGRGSWTVYPDLYVDGEVLATVEPAREGLLVPERGFGRLWREAASVRQALGYATTPEFGYVSPYEYHAGGTVNAAGVYEAGPGYHFLSSLYGERFRFEEADSTWRLAGG